MNPVRQFLTRVRTNGTRRKVAVSVVSMGRARTFVAWDVGRDTFIFERGIERFLGERLSILIVEKRDLNARSRGRVLTMSTGNHAVTAIPLLDGRFWRLSNLPKPERSQTLAQFVLCANVVGNTIEISQRDVNSQRLYAADGWLLDEVGFAMQDVVMADRNETTLEHYRSCGQEWRVKPLAWTQGEMTAALAASRKRISSKLVYYHSARGVHFLSFSSFKRFAEMASADGDEFVKALRELVAIYEDNIVSFARMPKYRGHHEIEFFGMRLGVGVKRIVPELEQLLEDIECRGREAVNVATRMKAIVRLYESLLTRAEFADDASQAFIESVYMNVTGEVYAVLGEGTTPAFDDRRTALPGVTYVGGKPNMHPLADARTKVLLHNLGDLMSKDELVEYANVYELRTDDDSVPIGRGKTREVVYKTNRSPLEKSLVEKRLSYAKRDYGSYMLARIGALKSLGIALSEYRLLRRTDSATRRPVDFYIRRRCEGEPMDSIPASYFRFGDDASGEDRDTILRLASLMGDAAAQNMAMKKFDPGTESPLYGIGKEIYAFEYDIARQRILPKSVSICSVRGSFGWPSLKTDESNLNAMYNYYMQHYAHALKAYQRKHSVAMRDLAERFMDGFAHRTHALAWSLSVMRDRFEAYDPGLPASYCFHDKWRFAMWALERQEKRLAQLKRIFFEKVRAEAKATI